MALLQLRVEQVELQAAAAERQPLHDRRQHVLRVRRHRDRDPERLADLLVLAQQHVEDQAVHRVVGAVVGDDADLRLRLAEAVDAPLALLVPCGIPGQVVVDDRVEPVLEVDPLGQAVRGDEHALGGLAERRDPGFALRRGQGPGDDLDRDRLREGVAQRGADVLRRRDEAAEEDRLVALLQQVLDDRDDPGELGVVLAGQRFGAAGHLQHPAAIPLVLGVRRPAAGPGSAPSAPSSSKSAPASASSISSGSSSPASITERAPSSSACAASSEAATRARGAQRRRGGHRAGADRPQQRQRRPPADPLPPLVLAGLDDRLPAKASASSSSFRYCGVIS